MDENLKLFLSLVLDDKAKRDLEKGLIGVEDALEHLDEVKLTQVITQLGDMALQVVEINERLAEAREEAAKLSQTAMQIGRVSQVAFVAGSAIVAGVAASAQQYVSFVEKAGIKGDEVADRWVAATKRVQNAQLNLGAQAAAVLLPIYEQAAALATKAAAFVQENPDLIRAALNTGLVIATLGAVGVAVSKGIKLYADFKYLAATAEFGLATANFQRSVREFLTGQVLSSPGASTTSTPGVGGALGKTLGNITLIATSVVIGLEAGKALGNALGRFVYGEGYKEQGLGDAALSATRLAQLPALSTARMAQALGGSGSVLERFGQILERNIGTADALAQRFLGVKDAAEEASGALDEAGLGLRDFAQEATMAQATNAYVQYRQQEAQAEQQYMAARAQIVTQGAAQLAQIEANYQRQRAELTEQFTRSAALALANFERQQAKAAEEFARQEAEALAAYQAQRAQLLADFQLQEKRALEDHQEAMRRLAEDHNARLEDLAASRDALGIVRENRAYKRAKSQAEEDFRREQKRRREDLARRLAEMDQQYAQERARRRAEFERRQAEAAEEFARQQELERAQFEQRLKDLDEQHKRELEETRRQTAERLQELQAQYQQEQIARRNAFFDILRDLDANLLNEQQTRLNYYQRMQDDLIRFLEATATAAQGKYGSGLPGYASGGYTPDGPIRSHAGEFILNRETARALEEMVGGRLTQGKLLQAAGGGRSVRVSVGPIHFDGRISAADRVEITRIAEDAALSGTLRALQEG